MGEHDNRNQELLLKIAGIQIKTCPPPRLVRDVVPKAMQMLRDRATGKLKPAPLRLVHEPWTEAADALGGGLWPGLYVVVGGTGTGKTQLCMSLALGAALEGSPVAYIGLELDDAGIVARLVGLLASRPWSGLYTGQQKANRDGLPMVNDPAVMQAENELARLPFQLVEGDPMGWPPDWLATTAQQLVDDAEKRGIDVKQHPPIIVLDFLQLVGDPSNANRPLDLRQRIQQAAYQARDVARRLGVAVIAVSSTARESAKGLRVKQDDDLPHPADLVGTGKESGEIEYSADGVLVLVEHPDARRNSDGAERLVSVALAKVRAGQHARLWLMFDGSKHRVVSRDEAETWSGVHKGQQGRGSMASKPKQGTQNAGGVSREGSKKLARGEP